MFSEDIYPNSYRLLSFLQEKVEELLFGASVRPTTSLLLSPYARQHSALL